MTDAQSNVGIDGGPNYDTEIDADELVSDLVEMSTEYARDVVEKRRWQRQAPLHDPYHDARYWELEALGGRCQTAEVIATLQPENTLIPSRNYRNEDGTVDVRGLMRWLSKVSEWTNEDRNGPYQETRQASEAHSAVSDIISMLRDDYGVGWPRFDDLGGRLECDLP